jgi:hypothetical protein
MSTWSEEELRRIAATDDLHIAPLREDGRRTQSPDFARPQRKKESGDFA